MAKKTMQKKEKEEVRSRIKRGQNPLRLQRDAKSRRGKDPQTKRQKRLGQTYTIRKDRDRQIKHIQGMPRKGGRKVHIQ